MGSGKSSLIAAVADSLHEGFVPLRVSVIGVEAGEAAAFARHAITEIRELPEVQLGAHETRALDRATAITRTQATTRELRAGFEIAAGKVLTARSSETSSEPRATSCSASPIPQTRYAECSDYLTRSGSSSAARS